MPADRGVAQSGSALGWGPSGRRFKSCLPDLSSATSVEVSVERGKSVRETVPRTSHAAFEPLDHRRDPVVIITADDAARVPELVPIRYGRMLTSSFAFYRGAAGLMAHDLAQAANTGLQAQLCGDAHLSNFGLFAAPDRRLVFDANDFDETLPGPFEWDVKRLVASLAIAARSIGADESQAREIAQASAQAYRLRMRELADMGHLQLWYTRMEIDSARELLNAQNEKATLKRLDKTAAKAQTRDSLRELNKLTEVVDGRRRIIADPPLITPIEDVVADFHHGAVDPTQIHLQMQAWLDDYASRLETDRRHLLEQYELVHMARKVVGVGSVGTRAWILLMIGRDDTDPLFLQVKEAGQSVLEPYLGKSEFEFPGQRVIAGQRLMQAATDVLIGWLNAVGADDVPRHFYVRQLKDWKGSAKIETMSPPLLKMYGELCARALARGHARSGDRFAISAYLGKSDKFDVAISQFAVHYAEQNERDYARLMQAVDDSLIEVRSGL